MSSSIRFSYSLLRSHLHQTLLPHLSTPIASSPILNSPSSFLLRHLSTVRRPHGRSVDIGARARQIHNRRLWRYGLSFACVAGFLVVVLSTFQDQMVFYITPTDALQKFNDNPDKRRFRLGGLVLEGSLSHPSNSKEMEFVVTDLLTDVLVRYEGMLPDLFREGHSVVVDGLLTPFPDDEARRASVAGKAAITEKARSGSCYFKASEVLAKHDEKYMPKEVALAIEKNKAIIKAEAEGQDGEKRTGVSLGYTHTYIWIFIHTWIATFEI